MKAVLVGAGFAGRAHAAALRACGVEIRGCERTRALAPWVLEATEDDYYKEYNALIYAVKIVDGIDAAMAHIEKYSTRHSEAIITSDYAWRRVRLRRGNWHFQPETACAWADGIKGIDHHQIRYLR